MNQIKFSRILCCIIGLSQALIPHIHAKQTSLLKRSPSDEQKQTRCLEYENNMTVKFTEKEACQTDADMCVVFITDDLASLCPQISLEKIEKEYQQRLTDVLKKAKFEGKQGQTHLLTKVGKEKLVQCLLVGTGKFDKEASRNLEMFRRSVGCAVAKAKNLEVEHVALSLPSSESFEITQQEFITHMTNVLHMAFYEFDTFQKGPEQSSDHHCTFWLTGIANTDVNSNALKQGDIIGQAVNKARYWGDLPANVLTPSKFAKEAKKIAKAYDLAYTILEEEDAESLEMGGFLAVTRGSEQDGKFVILEYNCKCEDAPTIALCGKGVIFDTGGVSLKSFPNMTGMKYDMCGAAAVIATMSAIAQLKPAVNVVGITPMVENMPDGNAARQDDIIRAMNGKSIEIKNTDAEGRLILSDALCYAESFYQPDVIIDIATLTGACLHALGHFYAGMISNDENVAKQLVTSGQRSGDRVWQMPFDDDYKQANKSSVANVANIPSSAYLAGSISAGCFLNEFISDTKWAHIDNAGTAASVPGINYLGNGGTGAGVRLLTDFIMNYKA